MSSNDMTPDDHRKALENMAKNAVDIGGGGVGIDPGLARELTVRIQKMGRALGVSMILAQDPTLRGCVYYAVKLPGKDAFEAVVPPNTPADDLIPFTAGLSIGIGLVALSGRDVRDVYKRMEDQFSPEWTEIVNSVLRKT